MSAQCAGNASVCCLLLFDRQLIFATCDLPVAIWQLQFVPWLDDKDRFDYWAILCDIYISGSRR